MRPLHLESLPSFILIRTCSPFWFDFASTEYPQRFAPHCSIRTLPSFSSVSHTPSGELADFRPVAAGAGGVDAGAAAGAVALEGSGEVFADAGACSAGAEAAGVCGSIFACSGVYLLGRLPSRSLRERFVRRPL